MSASFGVNSETVFALALFSNHPQRKEAVAQSQERQRERWQRNLVDPEKVIRKLFNEALSPLQDAVYGPLYAQLIGFHIDRIDFTVLDWALRGEYGIFLKQEPNEAEEGKEFSNQETTLFWKMVSENNAIFHRLKMLSKNWHGKSQGGKVLKTHFQHHSTVVPTHEGSFLIQTFLGMSLERINWIEVAAHLSGFPELPLES